MAASAASRVFAVPELYEQILLHVASETRTKVRLSHDHYVAGPNRGLLALYRVDYTTRATIIASPKLQAAKLSWGMPDSNQSAPYEPLIWLVHKMGLYRIPIHCLCYRSCKAQQPLSLHQTQRLYVARDTSLPTAYLDKSIAVLFTSTPRSDFDIQIPGGFENVEASWRDFPYSSEPQPKAILLEADFSSSRDLERLIVQEGGVATLGEIFDWLKGAWARRNEAQAQTGMVLPDEYVT